MYDPPADGDVDWEMADDALADVLDGMQPLNVSHEGGKFEAMTAIYQDMLKRYVPALT